MAEKRGRILKTQKPDNIVLYVTINRQKWLMRKSHTWLTKLLISRTVYLIDKFNSSRTYKWSSLKVFIIREVSSSNLFDKDRCFGTNIALLRNVERGVLAYKKVENSHCLAYTKGIQDQPPFFLLVSIKISFRVHLKE